MGLYTMSAADRKAQKEAYLAKIQAAKAQKEASAMQPAQQREGHEGGPSMNRQNSGIDHDNKNEMAGRNNKWEIQKKQFESQSQARSPGQRQVGGGGGGRASPAPAPALASALSAEERSREMRLALGKAPAMSVAAPVQLPTGGGKGGVDLRHWQREGYASEFDYAQAVGALDDRNSGPGGGGGVVSNHRCSSSPFLQPPLPLCSLHQHHHPEVIEASLFHIARLINQLCSPPHNLFQMLPPFRVTMPPLHPLCLPRLAAWRSKHSR